MVEKLLRRFKRRHSLRILLAAGVLCFLAQQLGLFGSRSAPAGSAWPSQPERYGRSSDDQPRAGVPKARSEGSPLPAKGAHPKTEPGEHAIKGGFLEVDMNLPATQHPIRQLIAAGQAVWDAKLERQSRTLKQAVEEYKRRHGGRNPPKGFDKWWAWREYVCSRVARRLIDCR